MDTRNTAGLSLSSYIAAYRHGSDAVLVPFVFLCNQRHQEHVLKLENALIFAGLATVRKAGCSFRSIICWYLHNWFPWDFFPPSCPYRQPEGEKRSAAFQTKEPLTARTLSALPALSSHQHDECPRSSFNRLHAQGAGLFKSMSHFSYPICFLHRNDLRAAFLRTSWFAKMKLSVKFGWG